MFLLALICYCTHQWLVLVFLVPSLPSVPWDLKLEPASVRSQGPWSSEFLSCLLGFTTFLNHLSMPLPPIILLQFSVLLGLAGEDTFRFEISFGWVEKHKNDYTNFAQSDSVHILKIEQYPTLLEIYNYIWGENEKIFLGKIWVMHSVWNVKNQNI